jgi:hypothetical protein
MKFNGSTFLFYVPYFASLLMRSLVANPLLQRTTQSQEEWKHIHDPNHRAAEDSIQVHVFILSS